MLIGVGGLAASVSMYWALLVGQRRLIDRQFRLDAEQRVGVIQSGLTADLEIIRALSAFYNASDVVERDEFHDFTETIASGHPSIRQLGWAPVVSASARSGYEGKAESGKRKADAPPEPRLSTTITQFDAGGNLVPAGQRDEYYPVHFLRPQNGATVTLGFDLGSDPACRQAWIS